MRVFVIPSWFPSGVQPTAGKFVFDHIKSVAVVDPEVNFGIFTWGGHDSFVSIRSPKRARDAIGWRVRSRPSSYALPFSHVFQRPVLTHHHRLPSGQIRRLTIAARHALKRFELEYGPVDLIHAHVSFPAGVMANSLANELGLPYVITEHMGPFPMPSLASHRATVNQLMRAIIQATAVIGVGREQAKSITDATGVRVHVIPNPVDEAAFNASREAKLASTTHFVSVGTLVPGKGHDLLIRGAACAKEMGALFHLTIVGDGPLRRPLEKLVLELQLGGQVDFFGRLSSSSVAEIIALSDCLVCTSDYESFSLTLVESLMSGRPVIATRCGGVSELLDSTHGIIESTRDPQTIGAAINKMTQIRSTFNRADLRKFAVDNFGLRSVGRQILQIYHLCLES